MGSEESLKKTSEASKESQIQSSPASAPSSAIPVEKNKTQASPIPPAPEGKVIPLKEATPSEKKGESCSGKESEKKAS